MKNAIRILTAILILALCAGMTACTGGETGSASSTAAPASSAGLLPDVSEAETSSEEELVLKDEQGYVIVRNMIDYLDLSFGGDCSACFPEDAKGYIIEGGPYLVDADTLRRIVNVPCKGSGTVRWINFKEFAGNPDAFTGEVPASKLNDPVFMSMNLPSEAPTFLAARTNPENMSLHPGAGRALAIGAIYRNTDVTLADDETFTVCLGRICLALKTKTEDWSLGNDLPFPTNPRDLYCLPWEISKQYKLPSDRLSKMDDHMEITLTGYDLNGSKYREQGAKGAVLHFWGSFAKFDSFNDVKGMVSSYVAWVKEPAAVGKLVATIGIDLYPPVSSNDNYTSEIKQAYSGYNHLLKAEPRIIFGHNVGPKAYDSVMDTEKVQKLIGLK